MQAQKPCLHQCSQVEGQGPAPNLAFQIISLKRHSPLRKGAACGLGWAGQEGRAKRRGAQEGNWEPPLPRCVHRPLVLFAAPRPWHMLRVPSPSCSFLSDRSEASGLNLSPPQSCLPGPPRPHPCPPVVSSRSLVCWPSSDASTFWAGTVCCPERPPHTVGASSVQEPAVAPPPLQASSRVHSGAAWQLRRRTQVSTMGGAGAHPENFTAFTPARGLWGHSWASAAGTSRAWAGVCCPVAGNGGLHIRDKLPTALCQSRPLQPGGAQGGHMPHAVTWVRHWAPLAQPIFLQGPQWSRVCVLAVRCPSTGRWEQREATLPSVPSAAWAPFSSSWKHRPGAQGHTQYRGVGSGP